MAVWNRDKKEKEEEATVAPAAVRRRRGISGKRFAVEVKLLAARAKESGLGRLEVADLSRYIVGHGLFRQQTVEKEALPEKYLAVVIVAIQTGLRLGNVVRMKLHNVDRDALRISFTAGEMKGKRPFT